MNVKRKPVALEAYEALADAYAARIGTKPHNAYLERPATLSLMPDVTGQRVLDAGCGPGVYTEWLVEHGALVTAFDISPKMVAYARQRVGNRATLRVADLGRPLVFLEDGSFDIVLSALSLDYIENWLATFKEFERVLRPSGTLVFSCNHPFIDPLIDKESNYFATQLTTYEWRGFGIPIKMPSYHRPLSAGINALLEAGFNLERLLEPLPTGQFKQTSPEDYQQLTRRPSFLCVRAVKSGQPRP
jgi:SAM-dependent methyltransferase